MQIFEFKTTKFSIFSSKFGDILVFEAGVIIAGVFSIFSFWKIQLIALPFFILFFLLPKYNNTITKIIIDEKKQIFIIFIDYFIAKKKYTIDFKNLNINARFKWLFNYYEDVIEIKNKNKIIAVMPITGSKYQKNEKKRLIDLFRDLASEGLIEYSETEKVKKSLEIYFK